MNIQIALDYEGYEMNYHKDYLYDGLYMDIISVVLKNFLYNSINLDDGYILNHNDKIYVIAGLDYDERDIDREKVIKNYEKLDNRLKKYFKLDPNDFVYYEKTTHIGKIVYNPYIKLEFTGIDSKEDMIYLDTIRKLVEKR